VGSSSGYRIIDWDALEVVQEHETLGFLPGLGLARLGPQGGIFVWGWHLGKEG